MSFLGELVFTLWVLDAKWYTARIAGLKDKSVTLELTVPLLYFALHACTSHRVVNSIFYFGGVAENFAWNGAKTARWAKSRRTLRGSSFAPRTFSSRARWSTCWLPTRPTTKRWRWLNIAARVTARCETRSPRRRRWWMRKCRLEELSLDFCIIWWH